MGQRLTPQTLRRLSYFAAIAEAGSIREAARRLSISVASVSEALAALEEDLATTLAVRTTRKFQLTEEGRRVAEVAHRVLEAGEALFANEKGNADLTGQVALTAPVEIAEAWLPEKLQSFKQACPKVGVRVSVSDHLVDLSQSAFDIGVRARFVPPGGAETKLTTLPLTCASAKPLQLTQQKDGWFTPETLITHRPGSTLDVVNKSTGETRTIQFGGVMIVDNKHVALAMVARNMGAALVTRHSLGFLPHLCEGPPDLNFGHIALNVEMRDTRPSHAAVALKAALTDTPLD